MSEIFDKMDRESEEGYRKGIRRKFGNRSELNDARCSDRKDQCVEIEEDGQCRYRPYCDPARNADFCFIRDFGKD